MSKKNPPADTAKPINEAHKLAKQCAETAIEHAIRCGKLLAEAKDLVPRGSFDAWVEKHCDFGRRTAYNYLKAGESCNALHGYTSLRQALGYESAKQTPKSTPNSPKGAVPVLNPKGTGETGKDRPAAPASIVANPPVEDSDAPEWTDADEAEAIALAEVDERERTAKAIDADDKLAEALRQIKSQAHEIGVLKVSRDGYMNAQTAAVRLVKDRERQIAALERKLKKADMDLEALRERIAIMEAA